MGQLHTFVDWEDGHHCWNDQHCPVCYLPLPHFHLDTLPKLLIRTRTRPLAYYLYRGFVLAKSIGAAVGVAILGSVILVGMFVTNYVGERRRRAKEFKLAPPLQFSNVALDALSHPYDTLERK